MLRAFHAFTQGGNYATPAALSGGMWEALLATAFGLAVAVIIDRFGWLRHLGGTAG